jgi:phosphate transport system substrate-binding protein
MLTRLLEKTATGERFPSWNIRGAITSIVDRLADSVLQERLADLRKRAPAVDALQHAPTLEVLTYPHTDGSTSTIPLERVVACRTLGAPYRWVVNPFAEDRSAIHFFPSAGAMERVYPDIDYRLARVGVVADMKDQQHQRLAAIVNGLLVRHGGTHGAWVNLIEGKRDFILVARKPSPDEVKLAATKGVKLDYEPVALDAFVFIVNRVSPLTNLSSAQVRDIYTGKIDNWQAVGGPDRKINAYQRNTNSGSQQLMLSLVMKDTPIFKGNEAWSKRMVGDSMMGPFHMVMQDAAGIGYSVFYYERYMMVSLRTRMIAIDGVHPTSASIAAGRYPFVSRVYAAVRRDEPRNSSARKLRRWLLTPEGQSVIAESGYVPINPQN